MTPPVRIGAATFVTVSEPLATNILASDQPKLLSCVVKSRLFKTLIPFSDEYKRNATDLFGRVNELLGSTLKNVFELKSDDIDDIPFRILNPRGQQAGNGDGSKQEDELVESYIAASYCWQWPQGSYFEKIRIRTCNLYSTCLRCEKRL